MHDVSVIVPTYNRPEKLRRCLAALAAQEGGPYPVIVVDDGGEVPLDFVSTEFGPWATLIRRTNGGPAAARNSGVAAARTTLLCFTDDDCAPRPDWVRRMAEAQGGVRQRQVGGRVDNALQDNICAEASQSLCSYLYEYFQSGADSMAFFTTNNICCRRDDFLALNGFDENFPTAASEDRDFGMRWRDAGGTLRYEDRAVVDHYHDLSLSGFWRQHSNYGRGARQLHLSLDSRGDARPKIEKVGFYTGLLFHPLRRGGRRPLAQVFLMGLSQVAMVAGYAQARRAERREPGARNARS
jgi:GT2 family glycosyltransferase